MLLIEREQSCSASDHWSPYQIKLPMALLGENRGYELHGNQREHFYSTPQKVGCAMNVEPIIEELLARTPYTSRDC